jgi:hypothetical protein
MRHLLFVLAIATGIAACSSSPRSIHSRENSMQSAGDTVRIANEALEYEIIIIDPGFNRWLLTNARPRGHYSQQYLENRNRVWVLEWNNQFRIGGNRRENMFLMPIDYQNGINYGYEVNYMLFNYLTYFQLNNNIRLGGFVPRI